MNEGARFVATGWDALDALLPGGGLPAGALTELLEEEESAASGAWSVAARAAARAVAASAGDASPRRCVVWVDASGDFFPPAALSLGLDPRALLVIRPARPHDALWAFDQAIRCGDVAASVAAIPRLTMPILRRLQLAAAAGGGLALLVRPAREAESPSAAAVRLRVAPDRAADAPAGEAAGETSLAPMYLIEVVKARGGWPAEPVRVEVGGDGPQDPLLPDSPPLD